MHMLSFGMFPYFKYKLSITYTFCFARKINKKAVLLKTEKDLSHRKRPKRTFGHRKGLFISFLHYKTHDLELYIASGY